MAEASPKRASFRRWTNFVSIINTPYPTSGLEMECFPLHTNNLFLPPFRYAYPTIAKAFYDALTHSIGKSPAPIASPFWPAINHTFALSDFSCSNINYISSIFQPGASTISTLRNIGYNTGEGDTAFDNKVI